MPDYYRPRVVNYWSRVLVKGRRVYRVNGRRVTQATFRKLTGWMDA